MRLEILGSGIKILEKDCWICGTLENVTNHHTLNQSLNPKKNVEIPLCRLCHDKLHGQDMNGLTSLAYKITKILKEGTIKISALTGLLNRKKNEKDEVNVGDFIKMNKK